jgi:hypothetical protein
MLAAAGLLMATLPAEAGGYKRHGYHHRHHGHHYRYDGHRHGQHHGGYARFGYHSGHHHDHDGAWVAGAFAGGLALGTLLTPPAYVVAPPPRTIVYAAPPPPAADCRPTTGTGFADGRPALFGGTFCYDPWGRGFVVAGSEYFIRYLN